jgi:hypothetical protein
MDDSLRRGRKDRWFWSKRIDWTRGRSLLQQVERGKPADAEP